METTSETTSQDLTCAARWGLPRELVEGLGLRLHGFWQRYRELFANRTRDPSPLANIYLRAQLTMETKRNFANIGRTLGGDDGQALEHFMSQSPWSARAVLPQIQDEVAREVAVQEGSALILDECADEKAGIKSAGAARQYNGYLGKVALCQVSVCLGYANLQAGLWMLVDGELFLPETLFAKAQEKLRLKQGIPAARTFATKLELGWEMIRRAQANGLPFEVVACDTLYGRDAQFRRRLAAAPLCYAAQVPADTQVYLAEPEVGLPARRSHCGRRPQRLRVLSQVPPREVRQIAADPVTTWQRVEIRQTERGLLVADFAVLPVWTVESGELPRAEFLVLRREASGELTYTLFWSPVSLTTREMITRSCARYFVERVFEDGKDCLGWDEFQGLKYEAWFHHLALTALALWFVAETKLDFQHLAPRDPLLAAQLEVELLPALSTANVRELLKAVLPLPTLSPEQAIDVVISHLLRRAASTRSRLKPQLPPASPP
jgi:SRSO17 transposase